MGQPAGHVPDHLA